MPSLTQPPLTVRPPRHRDVPGGDGRDTLYLKKAGFEQLIGQDIAFADGQVRVGSRAEARTTYMVPACHYVALSDERKEGLVQVAFHEGSGALVAGLEDLWAEYHPEFFPAGKVPPHFPVHLEQAVKTGMHSAESLVRERLSDFLSSMRRGLVRDVKNTREYYQALGAEMQAGLSHPNLTEPQRQERLAKIADLPAELARKILDVQHKYQVRVTISACAAFRLLVDVVQLLLELKYRKLQRSVRVTWNPLTRHLDPLVCERCRGTLHRVHPPHRMPPSGLGRARPAVSGKINDQGMRHYSIQRFLRSISISAKGSTRTLSLSPKTDRKSQPPASSLNTSSVLAIGSMSHR